MNDSTPTARAAHVAALRGGPLPPSVRLIDDPGGAEWTGYGWLRRLAAMRLAAAQRLSRAALALAPLHAGLQSRQQDGRNGATQRSRHRGAQRRR